MRIATRGSALALWQAREVARLIAGTGGPACELVVIRTAGDERPGPPDAPAPAFPPPPPATSETAAVNVKQLFVKEIEDALLAGAADLAVHSSKDLPATLPDGLLIAAALPREDPRDVLLLPRQSGVHELPAVLRALGPHPCIGTSSVRRGAALRSLIAGSRFVPMRGNVDTRLRKLDAGECDAIVLAAAGLNRLGRSNRISAFLPAESCVPAPGQGIVAVEIAAAAPAAVRRAVARIDDADASAALRAERAVVEALGGGCQMPLGVLATLDGQRLAVQGLVASLDGTRAIRATARGTRGNPVAAGERLAKLLIEKGAAALLT